MKQQTAHFAFSFLLLVLLVGCGSTLPEMFQQDAVEARANEIIGMFFSDDFESIWDLSDEAMRDLHTPESLRGLTAPYLQESGAIVETTKLLTGGDTNSVDGSDFALVLAAIQCTNKKINLRIYLNQNLELCGLYIWDLRR